MSGGEATIVAVAVMFAACCQASIGFGMGMLAAPVVAVIEPVLVPATLIMLATVVTFTVTVRERQHVDLRGTGWALLGRIPGSVVGAVGVALLPEAGLALALGAVVAGGIVLTLFGWSPAPSRPNLVTAGVASGILGTATSVGGPPMALMWQRSDGPELRGTMNGFFLVGSVVSVGALTVTGVTSTYTLVAFALLLPTAMLGVALSRVANRHLDRDRLRITAIAVSITGVVVLIGEHLF